MKRRWFLGHMMLIPVPGAVHATADPPAAKGVFRTASWDELIPKGWDPTASLGGGNAALLSDKDPRVLKLMRALREAWDNAPTNPDVDGAALKLPGYVVPLEAGSSGMKEFLLVPYFGACIHTPPPPANQIVHVVASQPLKGLRLMDAVWVSGVIRASRGDTTMGTSGYRMTAERVVPYAPDKKDR
jgi:hypothetical protein